MTHWRWRNVLAMAAIMASLLAVVVIVSACTPCRGWSCDDRNTRP